MLRTETSMAVSGTDQARLTLDRLCEEIEIDIVFGVYPGGARLTEESLIFRFEAKRHLVREALSQLEAKGFVKRVPNRGAVVVELNPRQVDEIYEVRHFLETAAARITPLPAPEEIIAELTTIQRGHSKAVRAEQFREVFALNILFHRRQFALCGNLQLINAIEDFSRRVHVIRAIKYDDKLHMQTIVAQHQAMVKTLRQADTEAYVAAVAAHLPPSAIEYRRYYKRKHGYTVG